MEFSDVLMELGFAKVLDEVEGRSMLVFILNQM